MHRLKMDTTKILTNSKLKTNFLSNKPKKLTWILEGSSPIQQNFLKNSQKIMLKNSFNKCLNKNICKKTCVLNKYLKKKQLFPQNIPKI